jgi:preprotein translocase subunit SecA
MEKTSKKERKSHPRESERAFGKREKQLLSSVKSHGYTQTDREREREGERTREMMFTTSRNTTTVSLCPQRHNGQHKKQSRKHQRTTNKKRTQTMSIKAMAKKGGKSGSNNDAPEGFGFPKRCDSIPSSSSVTSSRR